MSKESLVRNADVDGRLVVILAVQEAVAVLCLDDNLLDGLVVDASGHALHLGITVVRILCVRSIGVVGLVATKDLEFLVVFAQ